MSILTDQVAIALASNEELEVRYGDGDHGNFLSGWQCVNPFLDSFVCNVLKKTKTQDVDKYYYLEEDSDVKDCISIFHSHLNENQDIFFPSAFGSSSILFSFCALLRQKNIDEIYYIPPIYFSMHYALKMFGIRSRPVSALHAYEPTFSINLPEKKTILAFTDPVWFAGRHIPSEIVSKISEWQQRTGSTVFVDGSFQYMPWKGKRFEASSTLDPNLTFRLICPTKIMAIHGIRFAYLCFPKALRIEFTHVFTNIYASAPSITNIFSIELMKEMYSGEITSSLVELLKSRYEKLRSNLSIESSVNPDSGYFTFAKIQAALPSNYILMTQEFFEQKRYPGYAKLNLLSPSFHLIDPN